MPYRKTGRCLDPELLGTGPQKEGGEGTGPPYSGKRSQLEPSRDGENMRRNKGDPIPDMMKEN